MTENRYCRRLGIPVPRLEGVIARNRKTKLFHLMVVTLVEHGSPWTIERIAQRLLEAGLQHDSTDLELSLKRAWHGGDPVHRYPDGTFDLDLRSANLGLILGIVGARPPRSTQPSPLQNREEWLSERQDEASRLRRALIHAVTIGDTLHGVTLIDTQARSICTMVGESVTDMIPHLNAYDLLIGLRVRDTIHQMGLDPDRWQYADIASHPKSTVINRRGRRLTLNTGMLLRATTGLSRPLGEKAKLSEYVAKNQRTRLIRRLESDAKALYAFYRYGVLHGYIRLRWGFLDELLPVFWALPGDLSLGDVLQRAAESEKMVDIVAGTAPGWNDPWARAQRGLVVGISEWDITIARETGLLTVDRYEIQAVRIVDY